MSKSEMVRQYIKNKQWKEALREAKDFRLGVSKEQRSTMARVRSRIDVMPIVACKDKSCYGCSIKVKDYRQSFNLSKLAYPIAHVSLFRRHGFRYLETIQGEMNSNMAFRHGRSESKDTNIMKAYLHDAVGVGDDNEIVVDFNDCKSVDFDSRKLAEEMGIKMDV